MSDLVVKEQGALVLGDTTISPRDIILPAVAIRQNSYKKAYMKPFKPGDILLRPTDEKVGDEKKGAIFVPISIEHAYRVCQVTGSDVRTMRYEPYKSGMPWTFEELGKDMRRDECFVAHVIFREGLEQQAKMMERLKKGETVDPDDFVLPCRVVFARSSKNAGKVLNTHHEMSKAVKQSPSAIMFELKTVEMTSDKGTWYAFEVQKLKADKFTPKDLMPGCDFWANTLTRAADLKAHEDDEGSIEVTSSYKPETEERF